jgi:hypothetical protein
MKAAIISRKKQAGITLLLAMIMLAALMIGSIALLRSVDITTLVSGNLAFHHSTTLGGDRGIQAAVAWLESQTPTNRDSDNSGAGYCSSQHNLDDTATGWDPTTNWTSGANCLPRAMSVDAAGNTVDYLIHRLCRYPNAARNALVAGQTNLCATAVATSTGSAATSSKKSTFELINPGNAQFIPFRITVRVRADRGTRSFVQTTVLLPGS